MNFQPLVDALRAELQEYGALRNILDEQQKAIFARDADKVAESNKAIDIQIEAAARLRQARERVQITAAKEMNLPLKSTVAELSKAYPEAARPLLKALADEINSMIDILRRRSRQNQMLLARTCESMERTLRVMRPDAFTKTYSAKGAVALKLGPIGGYMQAAG
jgi:flagellar biosynthesis/type III secretory pathway chaperone